MKLKIGITGQKGFIGQHLYNTLGLFPDEFDRINFERDFFEDEAKLITFVSNCDVIFHLAAMNRHNDPEVIYDTNVSLVNKLVKALDSSGKRVHVIFSSSTQEEQDNLYGRSKKDGRELLTKWAKAAGGDLTGMVIPNVFGPFGNPFYNSFIATFCHLLTHDEQPKIDVDNHVKLIYVSDLVNSMIELVRNGPGQDLTHIPSSAEYKVSEILAILESFRSLYFEDGIIPHLKNSFEINLFNTFRSYIDMETQFPVHYTKHTDERGTFVEIIRLNIGGQVSFSTTAPGISRGNHYHTRKIERFSVIKGKALIQMRKIGANKVMDFYLDGDNPSYVDMPIWYTHNIKNIGQEELYTNFWINEFFDPADPDTYWEIV